MMPRTKIRAYLILISTVLTLFTTPTYAEGVYVGLSVDVLDYDIDGVGSAEPAGATLRFGNRFTERWSAEFRLAKTSADDFDDTNVDAEITQAFSILGRYDFIPAKPFRFYGVFGFSAGEAKYSAGGTTEDVTDMDASFGAGIELYGSPDTAITLEYFNALDQDPVSVSSLSLGFIHHF